MLKSDRFSCSQKIRLKRDPPVPTYNFLFAEGSHYKVHLFLLWFLVEWLIKWDHKTWNLLQVCQNLLFNERSNSKADLVWKFGESTPHVMCNFTVRKHCSKMSAISFEELQVRCDITDFNAHNISALLCSFLMAYFVMLDWFSEDSEVPHSVFPPLKDFSSVL